jgi:hypothetical protein
MSYNKLNFILIYNTLSTTFPEEGKLTTLSKDDFLKKISENLLISQIEPTNRNQFWKDIYEKNFLITGGFPIFYLYLSIICLTKELKETNFFKALHKFYEKIDEPKIKKENDILYVEKDFLNQFVYFHYRLVTIMAIPYVFSSEQENIKENKENKEKLIILYDKKKIFSYINEMFKKLTVVEGYIEFSNFFKLFPLQGEDIREIIAGRPTVD